AGRRATQRGGDQQHVPGAVAAHQPGLRDPDQALQRGGRGQQQPDHHPQDSRSRRHGNGLSALRLALGYRRRPPLPPPHSQDGAMATVSTPSETPV
ncbi:hypothetical protein CRUP_021559, partial [Coryphaenoides rupestris]